MANFRTMQTVCRRLQLYFFLFLFLCCKPFWGHAQIILLKNGQEVDGKIGRLISISKGIADPKGEIVNTPIVLMDNGLRRIYFHQKKIQKILEPAAEDQVKIRLKQPVMGRSFGLLATSRAVRVTPFDKFGRRVYEFSGPKGLLSIVQGITEITPTYIKVESLAGAERPIRWDMRIATNSIPRKTLNRILSNRIDFENLEDRIQVVRLFMQSQRYDDAYLELKQIVRDFPAEKEDRLQDIRILRQQASRLLLDEAQMRAEAGQHQLVQKLLANFPSEQVAGETLQKVNELLDAYEIKNRKQEKVISSLEKLILDLSGAVEKKIANTVLEEIKRDLNVDSLARFNTYLRLLDDEELTPEQKIALALSGWVMGSNKATQDFSVAIGLIDARRKIREYLREPLLVKRNEMLGNLQDHEAASIERIAEIIKRMIPPYETPDVAKVGPGAYKIVVSALLTQKNHYYLIQLPPEYNPLRKYPTILTLGDRGYSPELALDYWAGSATKDKPRRGQAMRHGYITISVAWKKTHQSKYHYTLAEHHAVLSSLRDAMRRFSIDTDRVYLTGHGIGGDAAWDLAVAHPDLWAGVLPILANANRYTTKYQKNGKRLPWYFVYGELDGGRIANNTHDLNKYLSATIDTTVVEYLGRGVEPYYDEILHMFDWMKRYKRELKIKEFEVTSMRPWDNYFWFIQCKGFAEKAMLAPKNWVVSAKGKFKTKVRGTKVRGQITLKNSIRVKCKAEQTTVWLGPEYVDFSKPIQVYLNGPLINKTQRFVKPAKSVLLEDVRTRSDRQHPFWAKISSPNFKANVRKRANDSP